MIKFEKVRLKGKKVIIDENGEKKIKQKTFFQTINPWNKNRSGLRIGLIKNADDILKELSEDIKIWKSNEN